MVEELGYGDGFKEEVDLWMSLEGYEKETLHLERIKLYFGIMPFAIFSLILFKLRIWICYSFLEKIFRIVFPKTSLQTLRAFLIPLFNITLSFYIYTGFSRLLKLLF